MGNAAAEGGWKAWQDVSGFPTVSEGLHRHPSGNVNPAWWEQVPTLMPPGWSVV